MEVTETGKNGSVPKISYNCSLPNKRMNFKLVEKYRDRCVYGALRGTLQGHQLRLGIGYGGNALQSTVIGGRGTREAEGPTSPWRMCREWPGLVSAGAGGQSGKLEGG